MAGDYGATPPRREVAASYDVGAGRVLAGLAGCVVLTAGSLYAGARTLQRATLQTALVDAPAATCVGGHSVGCIDADGDGHSCLPCLYDGDCATTALPAVMGYDVVSFRSLAPGECALEGTTEFFIRYGGYEWRFASDANRAAFAADPAFYAPKYGGFCALGIATKDAWTSDVLGPPIAVMSPEYCGTAWAIVDDALYLFNTGAQSRWAPGADIPRADARWEKWYGSSHVGVPVNTDAYGVDSDSSVCSCCSCDAALGYDCDVRADAPTLGADADADAHGCVASAGYAWCAATASCLRAFETACPAEPALSPAPAAPTSRTTRLRIAYGV